MSVEALVNNYLTRTGLRVAVKTNLGPEVVVYNADQPAERSALADMLQLGVIVRDRYGTVLAKHGGYPQTNPLLAGGLLLGFGGLLYVIGRGLARR